MKPIRKNILAALFIAGLLLSITGVTTSQAASQTSVNDAIVKGLNWLVGSQNADGSWPNTGWPAAETSMAVLAFEDAGHLPGNDTDPYHTVVEKGLDFLFTRAHTQALSVQPAGDPDTNGNGIGIYFEGSETTYVTPMVLMAIVASGNQSRVATTGPAGVIGRTYYDITVDIVDWLAYGQNDDYTGVHRGGWRYAPNYGSSDNSNSQWPVLGLMSAELWGINAPSWVKSELLYWLAYSQNLDGDPSTNYYYGSFGYDSKYSINNVAETTAGIAMLTYCGVVKTDPRIVAAQGYLVRDWATWDGGWRTNFNMALNYANEYAMFSVMKTMKLAKPTPIKTIVDYAGTPTIEWYNGTNQYADWLVTKQFADGHWSEWWYWSRVMNTAWGVLILLPYAPVVVKYDLTVLAKDSITGNPIPGATVDIVGPETHSGTTGADGKIKFPSIQAGDYNVTVSAAHYYPNSTMYSLTFNAQLDVQLTPIVHDLTVLVKNSVTGNPIPGASVQVVGPETRSDTTGGDGKVSFAGLREGDYTVTASASGFNPNSLLHTLLADTELEIQLTPIVTIKWATVCSVWTTDSAGNPKVQFNITETVYLHWNANGNINMTVYAPDGVTVEQQWIGLGMSGVNSFTPSHGTGIYTIDATGASSLTVAVGTFLVIPELPIGTAVALITMLGSLVLYRRRKVEI